MRPKVFISSTIFDFRDLRSALKYHLEQLGFEVMLSEFNDFSKPLDRNSYDACLEAVRESDYFILLVGSRIGGFYNAQERLSITRLEYRTAYEQVRAGRTKLIAFVREEIWNLREDRMALRRFLQGEFKLLHELTEEEISSLVHHKSTFANDAELVFDFLKEIGRIDEMKQAIAGEGSFPVGNWIHQFSSFDDILNVLKTEFKFTRSLSVAALVANLQEEILSNLSNFLSKSKDGSMHRRTIWASRARSKLAGAHSAKTELSSDELNWLFVIYPVLGAGRGSTLSTQAIDQALLSGEFLEHDLQTGQYTPSLIHNGLLLLRENIQRLKVLIPKSDDPMYRLGEKYRPHVDAQRSARVPNMELLSILAIHDCQENVINLSKALYLALNGETQALQDVSLYPTSPIEDESTMIAKERPDSQEIRDWILNTTPPSASA